MAMTRVQVQTALHEIEADSAVSAPFNSRAVKAILSPETLVSVLEADHSLTEAAEFLECSGDKMSPSERCAWVSLTMWLATAELPDDYI